MRKIKFKQITSDLESRYPKSCKTQIQQAHIQVIEYIINTPALHAPNQEETIIAILNYLSYAIYSGDSIVDLSDIDADIYENLAVSAEDEQSAVDSCSLNCLLSVKDIDWSDLLFDSIEPVKNISELTSTSTKKSSRKSKATVLDNLHIKTSIIEKPIDASSSEKNSVDKIVSIESTDNIAENVILDDDSSASIDPYLTTPNPTMMWEVSLKPPTCPRFDSTKVWFTGMCGSQSMPIYVTVPEVPLRQNDVSVTTNINLMKDADLMKMFPNHKMSVRASAMYDTECESLEYVKGVGLIFPIKKYTREQILDNIIKYPRIYQLERQIDDHTWKSFYSSVEVGGDLVPVADLWETLPEAKVIPKTVPFIREYIARRFLLERDVDHIQHKYPIWGSYDPWLVLYTTPEEYIRLGYTDLISMAKSCVNARISYWRTRNPILLRAKQEAKLNS